jgi:hypothetical protein
MDKILKGLCKIGLVITVLKYIVLVLVATIVISIGYVVYNSTKYIIKSRINQIVNNIIRTLKTNQEIGKQRVKYMLDTILTYSMIIFILSIKKVKSIVMDKLEIIQFYIKMYYEFFTTDLRNTHKEWNNMDVIVDATNYKRLIKLYAHDCIRYIVTSINKVYAW